MLGVAIVRIGLTNSVNYDITCHNLRHIAQGKRQQLSLLLVVSPQVSGLFCL